MVDFPPVVPKRRIHTNRSFDLQLLPFLKSASLNRGAIFGGMFISALLAFEIFNFGTTSFALRDVLGDLQFAGLRWSSILAFAFCGIDFAGIARIFTLADAGQRPASYQNNSPHPAVANQPLTLRPGFDTVCERRTVNPAAQISASNLPATNYPRPTPKPRPAPASNYNVDIPEPTYHPVGMSTMNRDQNPRFATRR